MQDGDGRRESKPSVPHAGKVLFRERCLSSRSELQILSDSSALAGPRPLRGVDGNSGPLCCAIRGSSGKYTALTCSTCEPERNETSPLRAHTRESEHRHNRQGPAPTGCRGSRVSACEVRRLSCVPRRAPSQPPACKSRPQRPQPPPAATLRSAVRPRAHPPLPRRSCAAPLRAPCLRPSRACMAPRWMLARQQSARTARRQLGGGQARSSPHAFASSPRSL